MPASWLRKRAGAVRDGDVSVAVDAGSLNINIVGSMNQLMVQANAIPEDSLARISCYMLSCCYLELLLLHGANWAAPGDDACLGAFLGGNSTSFYKEHNPITENSRHKFILQCRRGFTCWE